MQVEREREKKSEKYVCIVSRYTNITQTRLFTCNVVICLSLNLSSTYRRATEVLPTHPSPSKTTLKLYEPVPTTGLAIIPGSNWQQLGLRGNRPVLIRGIRNVRGPGSIKLRLLHLSRCGGYRVRDTMDVSLRPDTPQRRGDDDDDRASVSAASTSRNQLFCSEPLRATIGAFFVAFVI